MRTFRVLALPCLVGALLGTTAPTAAAQGAFVNWETPHVHPLDLTPDGNTLLAVNTPDDRLEVFAVGYGTLTHVRSIPVGLDPVSVRARTNGEAWVVNHVSDSISVVDLVSGRVVRTIATADEPADVVFAGAPTRAFVTCSQANVVQVFPAGGSVPVATVALQGEDPRALAVSPDGARVYAAIFESGNGSTILGGGSTMASGFPPNVVSDPAGPYGGQNPPPNAGTSFSPPIAPGLPTPPAVGLIVKKDAQGRWMDDNGGDWTPLVSGPQAAKSGRPVGWDLLDHDVAVIDANTLAVTYATRLMNIVMALAANPVDGRVTVVGTDATNEIRFEPVVRGRFVRVRYAAIDPAGPTTAAAADLNPHLTYAVQQVPQAIRDRSLGDPRGIVWEPTGQRAYVTGMGSNNVVVIDASGARVGAKPAIEVGEGPTGIVHHAASGRLFVLNKFAGSISIVDPVTETEAAEIPFHDPTPPAITAGRRHLYDTHATSGLGQAACASCHVDARMDRLAWDLGDPQGSMKALTGMNLGGNVPGLNTGFQPWHPMKGPMTTQTLQDVVGHEPLHWRGDRAGLEEFNGAFEDLNGDDEVLTPAEMQEFEDFLATIHFPPNPYRNLDNSLPTNLPLPGHHSPGRFSPKGTPLPNGDAVRALQLYRPPTLLDSGLIACSSCHTLPSGMGTDHTLVGLAFQPIPKGPLGESHHALVSMDGSTNVTMKIPHLRNLYEKVGFDTSQTANVAGFGFLHDGSVDTLAQFIAEPIFNPTSDQDLADLIALMLAFAGGDLPYGGSFFEPPAPPSKDTHAAVGRQTTLIDAATALPAQLALIDQFVALAQTNRVGLVVKGRQGGLDRGYAHVGANVFQSDRQAETRTLAQLKAAAAPGSELTFTVVPKGSEIRIGIDRDQDGVLDRDELDQGSDPADPVSVPGCGAMVPYGSGCAGQGGFVPVLSLSGCATAGGQLSLTIQNGRGGALALLLFGLGQGSTPIGGGCALLVAPALPFQVGPLPLAGTGAGNGTFGFTFPLPPTLGAGTVTMQAFVQDAAKPLGFSTTNGVALTIQ